MQSKQYFTKIKNYPHEKSTKPIPHLHLTTYVPRHAWASIARENGVSLSVISEGMGHTSEKTTRIYLASLSQVVMDEANHKVLSSI